VNDGSFFQYQGAAMSMNWTPLNLTIRVGCNLAYDTTVPTPVLFVLKPRLEGRVLVMQEKLSFGIGLPAYEFQDSHGNITYRSMLMPGRNEIRHDALVAVHHCRTAARSRARSFPLGNYRLSYYATRCRAAIAIQTS